MNTATCTATCIPVKSDGLLVIHIYMLYVD